MNRYLLPPAVLLGAAAVATMSLPANAATTDRAVWHFEEVGGTTAFDSSGNGNDGANDNVLGDGGAYTFDGVDSRVVVPNSLSLNPGADDFSFSVTFTTSSPAVGEDYDLLRKGLAGTTGGEYKVEVLKVNGIARALCLVKDTNKVTASIRGTTDLADGAVHTITCNKTSTGVTMFVDALAPRTKTVHALGSVSNVNDLFIGTKQLSGGDWFQGSMLEARVGSP